jgi:hypothetical protein
MTPDASETPNTKVTLTLRLTGNGQEAFNIASSYLTNGDPLVLLDHALDAVCGAVTAPGQWFESDDAKHRWDRRGQGTITLDLAILNADGTNDRRPPAKSFTIEIDTTGSLRREFYHGTHTIKDYANAWRVARRHEPPFDKSSHTGKATARLTVEDLTRS